jgi:hypothetical protein
MMRVGVHRDEIATEPFGTLDVGPEIQREEFAMNGIIYLVGLVIVVMAVFSLLGLR